MRRASARPRRHPGARRRRPGAFFVDGDDLENWQFLKGAKSLTRISRATGIEYTYDEGPIPFPDPIDRPVADDPDRRGRLDAVALQAPDPDRGRPFPAADAARTGTTQRVPGDWTTGMSDGKRAFMMGNALVVGLVETNRRRAHRRHRCVPRVEPRASAAAS